MWKNLKQILIYTCIAYTCVTMFTALVAEVGFHYTVTNYTLFIMFLIVFVICTTIQIIEQFDIESQILTVILHITAIHFWGIFVLGHLLKVYPLVYPFIPMANIMIFITYAVVYVMAYVKNQAVADKINEKIKNRRKGKEK